MIAIRSIFDRNGKRQFAGLFPGGKVDLEMLHIGIIALPNIRFETSGCHFATGSGFPQTPAQRCICQLFGREIADVQIGREAFTPDIGSLGIANQRNHRSTKFPELFSLENFLALPEGIEQAHQGRTLPRKIMQVEQLETADTGRFQRPLDLLLVQQRCQLSRSPGIICCFVEKPLALQILANGFEIERAEHAGVLFDLGQIRIDRILSDLMRNQRHVNPFERRSIIPIKLRRLLLEDTLSADPTLTGPLRDEKVVARHRCRSVSLFEGEGRCRIEPAVVGSLQAFHQVVEQLHVALQFVTHAHQAERRMVAVIAQDAIGFGIQEIHRRGIPTDVQRP